MMSTQYILCDKMEANSDNPETGQSQNGSNHAHYHYSYDSTQYVHMPHSDQQVSKIYYLRPRKVPLLVFKIRLAQNFINPKKRSIELNPLKLVQTVISKILFIQ